jgi:hypothetical protein
MQVHHSLVASEVSPRPDRFGDGRVCQCSRGGKPCEKRFVERDCPLYLDLLQHHLGDQHPPRVSRPAPWQVPRVLVVPGDQSRAHRTPLGFFGPEIGRVVGLPAHLGRLRTEGRSDKERIYRDPRAGSLSVCFRPVAGGRTQRPGLRKAPELLQSDGVVYLAFAIFL